ncbi:KEOPS complex subunit Pcc1 [Picrophilus oshimae]|uniref:KEOPS complex subunit Pcc1 n=1 Tax=Picrophilus torridus (strain ATCC 700027 / DSM 9790 / JCM 10055 / NBRC 100828 / KAW 2/3) TaxID=1122961 RepID=A0A8G2FXE2_PICTO|nr:KEOPS complex subunit Pcc1 [Picrophilus oshimae]SMD31216.1 KEOPS complex subunit Pcc1 [Picrophilus oshimae DSM 9789]
MIKITITLDNDSYLRAVEPDIDEENKRTKVYISGNNIIIEALDVNAARAAISTIARVLNVTRKIMEVNVW